MGYHRPGDRDLRHQIADKLHAMERFGRSKYADKAAGAARDGIYSHATAQVYARECQRFASYVADHAPQGNRSSLADARAYGRDFVAAEVASGRSAYSIKLTRSALGKLYGCDGRDFGAVPERSRAEITRSRARTIVSPKSGKEIKNPSTRAGHFGESRHPDEVAWARSTGMRRSEMASVRGDQVYVGNDGRTYVRLDGTQCKGGRERTVPVIGNDVERVRALAERAGHERVFAAGVPARMDVHHYRAEYATAYYTQIARDPADLPRSERYVCRGDLRGTVYDRESMRDVSEALGHSRISVIAEHYLR